LIAEIESAAAAARSAGVRARADRGGTGAAARPTREESLSEPIRFEKSKE
jgi:hypothetical protein